MLVKPDSIIRVLKNVPLDGTYKNTLWFDSLSKQVSYFASKAKYTISDSTVVKHVGSGVMRLPFGIGQLHDCNYIMFKNTGFNDKWFFAFLTDYKYVNNGMTEVTYVMDVMQTWLFDYEFRYCFVEREHSDSDFVGDNLEPENLELGEYMSEDMISSGHMGNYKYIAAATFDKNYNSVGGVHYAGIYSGLRLNVFDTWADLNNWIVDMPGNLVEGLVNIYMMPADFVQDPTYFTPKWYTVEIDKYYGNFGTYKPRNNKLYTYPYNFLYVSNLEGNSAVFPYEYFSNADKKCKFFIGGDMSATPTVILHPFNYKGVASNIDEKLTIAGFPQCSWNNDAYVAWLAQTSASQMTNLATSFVRGSVYSTVNPAFGAVSMFSAIANHLAQRYEHSIMPNQARGNAGNSAQVAFKIKDFAFMHKHITEQYAMVIDNYFDMFGYATNTIKVPNRNVRENWTYTKTVGCTIVGSMPADDMKAICDIYDKGVTFWNNPENVGCYYLTNKVVI